MENELNQCPICKKEVKHFIPAFSCFHPDDLPDKKWFEKLGECLYCENCSLIYCKRGITDYWLEKWNARPPSISEAELKKLLSKFITKAFYVKRPDTHEYVTIDYDLLISDIFKAILARLGQGKVEETMTPELMEALASVEHERWSGWMRYQFSKGRFTEKNIGEWIMPVERVAHWQKLINTPYAHLS